MADPVIIVGAGPVGLFLALELGQKGIDCVVLDSQEKLKHYPRANTHSARSMEHYRRLGLTAEFRRKGLPAEHSNDVVYMTRLTGHELARVKLPTGAQQLRDPDPHTPEPTFRSSQMYLEPLLLGRLKSLRAVTLLLGHEVHAVGQDEHGVWADLQDRSGRRSRLSGSYLVGCDGPRSVVRRSIGSSYIGEDGKARPFFGGRMWSSVFRSHQFDQLSNSHRAWQYWIINPDIRALFLALDGESLFLCHTQHGDGTEFNEANIRADIVRAVGCDIDLEVVGSAIWQSGRGLVADRFGDGRIFIAGDAAHLFTPTGGFGLNTGIDDAANLAWKIAAAVQGWAGPMLLGSYDAERRAIGIRNTRAALGFADAVGNCPVPADIEGDSTPGVAARETVSLYLGQVSHREFLTLGVQLGACYEGSPVIVPDGTEPVSDDFEHYRPSVRPGGRLPHYWRAPGLSVLDEIGPGFTLLCVRSTQTDVAWEDIANAKGIPFKRVALTEAESFEHLGSRFVLVRPDQHVAWHGDEQPGDIAALLERVRGAGDLVIAEATGMMNVTGSMAVGETSNGSTGRSESFR